MDGTRGNDPLRTLELLVGVIVSLMALLAGLVLLGTIVGTGTIPGVNAEVCASTAGDAPAFRRAEGDSTGPVGLGEGITWRADEVQICDPDPDGGTRALAAVGLVVWAGAPLLFFSLLWRLLRRARREGVFADRVPGGLRTLGRILVAWAVLDFFVSGLVDAALLTRMTDSTVILSGDVPWLPVLVGVTLLALARVIAQAVDLRRDAEATI
ncbi:hypothetical protein CFI00_16710 [Nocardioides sp. S5]|uniref:DUF2975 domain-containing protein n=1 Tax=Nocardioides sp. S5 TaxID=2017486 RepID=UPI001A905ED9|nr:DUF2975 domain-containing protein [Nocardioides sp. S5]QSR32118.1 hypothetical protein CFI00_16710 [Nocardioides sp. S5]